MDISKINVNNVEYNIKDEYARNNLGVSEAKVQEVVSEYVTEHKADLKGDKGDKGEPGANGKDGLDGMVGANGADGKSAYDIARDNGFDGTEKEWIDSLKGKDGVNGETPQRGTDYWTSSDKEEILSECKSYIDSEILGGES